MAKYTQKRKLLKVKSRKNSKTGKRLKRRVKHKGGNEYPKIIENVINNLKSGDKLFYYNADDYKTENTTNVLETDEQNVTFDKPITVGGVENAVVNKQKLIDDIAFDYKDDINCFGGPIKDQMKIMRDGTDLIKKEICEKK